MNLNEQLIEDMFQEEGSREQVELPREDVSLNFTVSSRSSKPHKKQPQDRDPSPPLEILALAHNELSKFNHLLADTETKANSSLSSIALLLDKLQLPPSPTATPDDLALIRSEIFRREGREEGAPCRHCHSLKGRVSELEESLREVRAAASERELEVGRARKQLEQITIQQVGQNLLSGVEFNLGLAEIRELNLEISALRSEKANLERTSLFNKTKNSELQLLQKSKGLSAAKNSTNSSEAMRQHETIVFIDPMESDVDEWVKFFEFQKAQYEAMCRREENDRQKDLGRKFTKEERRTLHAEGRLFLLFSAIKEVLQSLLKIRENTGLLMPSENTSKSSLKERLASSSHEPTLHREEIDRLTGQINKLSKVNQYLQREKENLEEINLRLKDERLRENTQRHLLEQQLKDAANSIRALEEECSRRSLLTEDRQDECVVDRKPRAREGTDDYQARSKALDRKLQESLTTLRLTELQVKSLEFRLRKEALERRRLHNQVEDSRGSVRVFCRIRPKLMHEQNQPVFAKAVQDRVLLQQSQKCVKFDQVFSHLDNSQEKIFQDIRKLVQSALDGFNLTVFAYGQTGSGKSYTMHGSHDQLGIIPRLFQELFKLREADREFIEVGVSASIVQLCQDRLADLLRNEKGKTIQVKEDEAGSVYLTNCPLVEVESLDSLQDLYYSALKARKRDDASRTHFIVSLVLQISNRKTQEQYHSKVNLIDLAGSQKQLSSDSIAIKQSACVSKNLTALALAISSMNKSAYVPFRQNKLTHLLKDSLTAQAKVVVVVNVAPGEGSREETRNAVNFGYRLKGMGLDRNRKENEKEEGKQRRSISRMSNS